MGLWWVGAFKSPQILLMKWFTQRLIQAKSWIQHLHLYPNSYPVEYDWQRGKPWKIFSSFQVLVYYVLYGGPWKKGVHILTSKPIKIILYDKRVNNTSCANYVLKLKGLRGVLSRLPSWALTARTQTVGEGVGNRPMERPHGREGHVKAEAENGVMWPQTRDGKPHQQHQK